MDKKEKKNEEKFEEKKKESKYWLRKKTREPVNPEDRLREDEYEEGYWDK